MGEAGEAVAETAGAWWRGLRTVAWLRLTALVECGTRAMVDAVAGPVSTSEKSQAQHLCRALCAGMLHLADRGSDGLELLLQAARTGAHLLWRVNTGRLLPAIEVLDDGSWLPMVSTPTGRNKQVRWVHRDRRRGTAPLVQGLAVRVIEADITVTDQTTGATRSSSLRLVTTLLDPRRYPAQELAALYHERWGEPFRIWW